MSRRATAARVERVRRLLVDRDLYVVAMLGTTKLATGDQLRRVVGFDETPAGKRAARRQLARLAKWQVVERLERRVGGVGRGSDAYTYGLGLVGQRLDGGMVRGRQPHLPRPAMWDHILMGSEVYARASEYVRARERHLSTWQGEPAAWRNYSGPAGEVLRLKPDAYVVIAGPGYEDTSFVECDTGSQSPRVIRAKLAAYERYAASGEEQRRHEVFPRVVFVTKTETRRAQLVDLIGSRDAAMWRLFAVGLMDDAARLLAGAIS